MAGSFEIPQDATVRASALIVFGALAFLVIITRVFRDVNPG